ncbi:MAG: GSU2403 family nucleotidyltransferase fold protein [Thermoanaerobaculia bacterium]
MSLERLPEATQTLYAELLDQMKAASIRPLLAGRRGSFVSKEIRGRRYWYLQKVDAGRKRQIYLGAESPELLGAIRDAEAARAAAADSGQRLRELVSMLVAGGLRETPAAPGAVLTMLADLGMFRAGGVLVGTHAFAAYGAMLGVRLEGDMLRTQDIDIAHDPIAVAVDTAPADLPAALREIDPKFFAVPTLDPRKPSMSFAVRGRDLRVDFLTPARGRSEEPVPVPRFAVAAQPLRHLGFLTERGEDVVLMTRDPILVVVPDPARFALHKLWTAAQRPAAEQTKSRKDLRQAHAMVEVLLSDRADSLVEAAHRTRDYRGMLTAIRASAKHFGDSGRLLADLIR